MIRSSRPRGWPARGLGWVRAELLKPIYGWLSGIEHPRAIRTVLQGVEAIYRRSKRGRVRLAGDGQVVLFVAVSVAPAELEQAIREIRVRQLQAPGCRPVLLTDHAELLAVDLEGVLVEYLPDHDSWCSSSDPEEWSEFLENRIQLLRRLYAIRSVEYLGNPRHRGPLATGSHPESNVRPRSS